MTTDPTKVVHTSVPGEHSLVGGDLSIPMESVEDAELHTPSKPAVTTIIEPTRPSIEPQPSPKGFTMSQSEITSAAGAMAGFCAGVSVCPLDVAKTRLQAQGSYLKVIKDMDPASMARFNKVKYKGLVHTLNLIWNEEGIRGLYRGLVPITLGYFPTWMIYFSCYEQCKQIYPTFIKDDNLSYFASALTSGACSTTLTNPIWVVKTRLMLQMDNGKTIYDRIPQPKANGSGSSAAAAKAAADAAPREWYKGTFDAFSKMLREEGVSSFYRGLLPSYFGLLHVAIQFPLYENIKKWFNIQDYMSPSVKERDLGMFFKFILASALSKCVASAVTYPHEIVRTRLQMFSNSGIADNQVVALLKTVTSIYYTEGIKGFYSGFVVNLFRTVPASAITMVSFEYFKKVLQRFSDSPKVVYK